ncbi:MAG: hypothetical protein PHW24_03650 [Candidatus Moranbacteria bacterium]|nr:hypothetical protein [Candidatus Moranbacteria bacterium]
MNERFRIFFYYGYKVGLHVFAVVGFVLVVGFFAVRFHWTDVAGAVDRNSDRFQQTLLGKNAKADAKVLGVENQKDFSGAISLDDLDTQIEKLSAKKELRRKNYCLIDAIGQYSPGAAAKILQTYKQNDSDILASKMILAARLRLEEKDGSNFFASCDNGNVQPDDAAISKKYLGAESETIFPWMDNDQWNTIREAIVKDKDVIEKAATMVGIEPRLLVSCAIVEQVRLFNSDREMFKKFFEPLKILGNANKISLGIMGIKENTAIETENHLKDANSPYYLGMDFEHALDFENGNDGSARYDRLTENTHYYSYLYGAIYLKQMMTQWKNAGFDITYRPEIVGTLFNVGFSQSKPNANPKVGGSNIDVQGAKYTFGSLAYEFYYSGELLDAFPYVVK